MPIPNNWYESFFHGLALDLWRKAIPPEQTKAEAEFLVNHLNCESGAQLLDLPCGNGRLSFEMAKRGYQVTGVDISVEFIEEAHASVTRLINPPSEAGGTDYLPRVEFILGDMRRIEDESIYDGAYCFGNSFGFLDYADMEIFLGGVARALKPGGRFIIETGMAAESILTHFEEQACYEVGDITMTVKERYLAAESCIDSEYIFEQNGKTETCLAKHWIYTSAEIQRVLRRAGFVIVNLYGSLKCEPYKLGSQELFVVAVKAETRP